MTITKESVGVAQVDVIQAPNCRYCGGAKRIQIVSPVSDHAWADCFCTRLSASPEQAAMRLVPVERLREWYSCAWTTWIETITDDGGEDNASPTPRFLQEMEETLAAAPTQLPPPEVTDEAGVRAALINARAVIDHVRMGRMQAVDLTGAIETCDIALARPTSAGVEAATIERCARVADASEARLAEMWDKTYALREMIRVQLQPGSENLRPEYEAANELHHLVGGRANLATAIRSLSASPDRDEGRA